VPTRPALVPIVSPAVWVALLRGVTVPDVGLKVLLPAAEKRRVLGSARGSMLFTHFGLSGPVALDVSRHISGQPQPEMLSLECDYLPARRESDLDEEFRRAGAEAGKRQISSLIPDELPRRLAESIVERSDLRPTARVAELSRDGRARLVAALKRDLISISGTRGFKSAEVTAGGIALDEIDSRSMQSKLVPNLYVAGELLDLDGPIGGYNFQAAFSTGWLAGTSVEAAGA
jgi:hypothetical protein